MNKMNRYDVMWKCPLCDRMIPDSLYMVAKMHGVCECKEQYYWQFDKFIIDKDDKIGESIDIPDDIEQEVRDIIKNSLEVELGETYLDGYYTGYKTGYNERYKDRNDTIMNGKYMNIKDNV